MNINQYLQSELLSGEKCIGFFIHNGVGYWVCDAKYNFSLDAEKDYRAYLEKGHINQAQFDAACIEFRGGILRLTAENFLSYVKLPETTVLSMEEAMSLFGEVQDGLLGAVESYLSSGLKLSQDDFTAVNEFSSRLPLFYINFDRSIYFHMDYGRFHEDLAYPEWIAKENDFLYLIPDAFRYWVSVGDCWKMRFV